MQLASRHFELELLDKYRFVAGMDEVGRGALAGPVTVGVVIVDCHVGDSPEGLGDSKLLSPAKRQALCDPIRRWAVASAVGHAQASEIDQWGIIGALRIAGQRALCAAIEQAGAQCFPDVVILDGSHDWLSEPQADLLSVLIEEPAARDAQWEKHQYSTPPVIMRVKADRDCSVVAAASNLAKVERDALMSGYDDPGYAWASNKGYAARAHIEGLRRLGPSLMHRQSWKLPGVTQGETSESGRLHNER